MRDPSKVQLQPRGNIASQALTAVAKQPGIWSIVGACKISFSVDLFCSVLHLLGTRTKVWGRWIRELLTLFVLCWWQRDKQIHTSGLLHLLTSCNDSVSQLLRLS